MAKAFLTNIDLKGNQLLNAVIHSASQAPNAKAAGQLYFNTGDSTFYYSTGTGTGNWSPVGVQFISSVGSNLSVGFTGELNISSTPSFSSITLTSNGDGNNITIGDDAYIGDLNVANHIAITGQEDETKGGIVFGTAHTESISSNGTDLSLGSSNDIIFVPGVSGYAYLGVPALDGNNRVATLGDITGDALIDSVNSNQLQINSKVLSLTNNVTIADKLTIGGNTFEDAGLLDVQNANGYTVFGIDSTGIANDGYHGYNTYTDKTGTIYLNSLVNIASEGNAPSGFLFVNSSTTYHPVPALHLESSGDLALRAGADGNDGNIILYTGSTSGPGTGKVYIGWNQDANQNASNQVATLGDIDNATLNISGTSNQILVSNTSGSTTLSLAPATYIKNTDSGYPSIMLDSDGEQIAINDYNTDTRMLNIGHDGTTDAYITAAAGNLSLNSNNGDIVLNPDGQVIVQNTNLIVGNNIYVKNGIFAGGSDTGTDGYVRIQNASGSNLFTVDTSGGEAEVDIHGYGYLYTQAGTQYGNFGYDGDNNYIIAASNNNLILQSDNSNSVYLGSVSADNKVVKFSDLTAVQSGLNWKQAVNLLWDDPAATGSGLSGTLTIDGHPTLTSTNNGYRILVINNGVDKGIYTYSDDDTNWTLTRSTDADTDAELKGAAVFVEEGTVYGSTAWVQQNHYVTGFADQNWVQFSGQGTYIGSNSILVDGNEISVKLDSDSLEVTSSGLKVNYHTDGGLDNDSGLYVKTADGVKIDSSGNVAADYTAIETQLTTDGFFKSTDISNVTRKYTTDISGNGTKTYWDLSHGLGNRDVVIRVYQTSTGPDTKWADVEVDIERSDANANDFKITFASAPASGTTYGVVVIG